MLKRMGSGRRFFQRKFVARSFRACALALVLITATTLHAGGLSSYRKAAQQLEQAAETGEVSLFLEAAEIVGVRGGKDRGLRRVFDAAAAFAVDVTPETYETLTGGVTTLLQSRESRLRRTWSARFRGREDSDTAKRVLERFLVEERDRLDRVTKALEHWFSRLLIVEGRGRRGSEEAVVAALQDADARVVRRALGLLPKRRELSVLEAVLESYEVHRGRSGSEWERTFLKMKAVCEAASGVELRAMGDYRSWLEGRKQGSDTATVEIVQSKKRSSRTGLFGLKVTGQRMVFVLDVSGSMDTVDRVRRRAPQRARTSVGASKGRQPEARVSRLERAKKQLVQVIQRLGVGVRFNIVTFSSPQEVVPWREGLIAVSAEAKAEARQYVMGLRAGGVTATDVALETAFARRDADSIYLISDGVPTHLGGTKPGDTEALMVAISRRVRELNLLRDVRVFTLGFPQVARGYEFLAELARENGGRFIKIEPE